MKRRPYIPLSVRVKVAERQLQDYPALASAYTYAYWYVRDNRRRLDFILLRIFPDGCQLDHDPALSLRKFNSRTGRYTPDANDPRYLVYRLKDDHLQKTTGRKPGAERTVTSKGSDVWLAKKYRKQERPKKSKSRIPSRPFSKEKRRLVPGRSSFATRAGKGF